MQCYLPHGFGVSGARHVGLEACNWGDPSTRTHVFNRLKMALCEDRWHRVANQESAAGPEQGIDWTVPRRLLKQAAKRLLVASGLRMLCQGAIRRAGHGGDLLCPRCGAENSLRHVLHDCSRWAVFDLGPDPALSRTPLSFFRSVGLSPNRLLYIRTLCLNRWPRNTTVSSRVNFSPFQGFSLVRMFLADLEGADPRMRVVSWAVVPVRVTTHPVHSPSEGTYEFLGTMTGTLQIGATVNEGEQVAINKLAEWATMPVRSSSDSKVAIKKCLKANIHETLPQVWSTSLTQRELLQLSWTKGYFDATQHCHRFGLENWWMWATTTWPAAERAQKCFRTSKPIAPIVSTRPPEQNFPARDVRTSLLTTRSLGSKKLFEAAPVVGRKATLTGPNKRQRLLAATQGANAHTGHNWVVTTKTYASSAQSALSTPNKSTLMRLWLSSSATRVNTDLLEPSASAGIHPSHLTLNLGHQWSCSRCNAHSSVRAKLAKECKGARKKGGQRLSPVPRVFSAQSFAALFAGRAVPPVLQVLRFPNFCFFKLSPKSK